jgi:hypothetical protein
MDWFERLTGFREAGYDETRRQLEIDGRRLRSRVNGRSFGIGTLELVSLKTLRERVRSASGARGRLKVTNLSGDVRRLHQAREYAGALFQVASQFNLLEMTSPEICPEDGVTRYQHDRTQGPACAIAAGAGTIYRNYFAPVGGQIGQTRDRQLDGLVDLSAALSQTTGLPPPILWKMTNGYALCSEQGLEAISGHLNSLGDPELDELRGKLRIGVHQDVEVTESNDAPALTVNQALCSALPVAYSPIPAPRWRAFAGLVLEAAYEATLCAAVLHAARGGSNIVLLTRVGGGAFGNDNKWVDSAMRRALELVTGVDLDIRLVSFGPPPSEMISLAQAFT